MCGPSLRHPGRFASLAALLAASGLATAGALRVGDGASVDGKPDPPTPLTRETRDGVVYKHLSKTGGMYIRHLLLKALGGKAMHLIDEGEGLGPFRSAWAGGRARPFVIGSMRNPCDYYVSLWAYNSHDALAGGAGLMSKVSPELRPLLGLGNNSNFSSADDVQRFRRWLRALASPRFNLLSTRFWIGYFSPTPKKYQDCRTHKDCVKDIGLQLAIARDLEPTLKPTGVDCWVFTESAQTDLRVCLDRYLRERNVTQVDWTYFDKKIARPGNLQHRSVHMPCAHYYDQDSVEFVRKMDRSLIDAFGFQSCCTEGSLPWSGAEAVAGRAAA